MWVTGRTICSADTLRQITRYESRGHQMTSWSGQQLVSGAWSVRPSPATERRATFRRSCEPLGQLRSGEFVVDRPNSHINPDAIPHIAAALSAVDAVGRGFLIETVPVGEDGIPIGEQHCVVTGPSDDILFAQRPFRPGLTRFVKVCNLGTHVIIPFRNAVFRVVFGTGLPQGYMPVSKRQTR